MNANEVLAALGEDALDPPRAFAVLKSIAGMYATNESAGRDLLIWVLDRREAFSSYQTILNGLLARYGLFPYMQIDGESPTSDSLIYEFHRPIDYDRNLVFHRVQADVYRRLMDGENVILSAPTSFGKSLVLDALVASGRFSNVAVVVPTLALIDETRKRLSRLRDDFKIITHPSQEFAERNLLVMTQERLLEVKDLPPLDLFMMDEFYKLDSRNEENRPALLNQALRRLMIDSRAFYMAGPNIQALADSLPESFTATFTATDFSTVASNLRIMPKPERGHEVEALVDLCRNLEGPTLIFCSSPEKTRRVAQALLDAELGSPQSDLETAAAWVADQYHPEWLVTRALPNGIGIHHARLPRWLGQYTVDAFNRGSLKFLVCTSTLIEGVNTSARNVVVFDHRIKNKNIDYFTYSNIAGRSGRMQQHFVGEVIVFREPPDEELPIVDVPIYTQGPDTPLSLLIQLDDEELTETSKTRLAAVIDETVLPTEVLRESRGVDPERQTALARTLLSQPALTDLLAWSGYPDWDRLEAACRVIIAHLRPVQGRDNGVSSPRQLAFLLRLASTTEGDVRELVNNKLSGRYAIGPDAAVEEVLGFLRQWVGFDMPRLLACLERVVNHVQEATGRGRRASYGLYIAACENMFMPPHVALLEEFGLPPQLVMKLAPLLPPSDAGIDAVLAALRGLSVSELDLDALEVGLLTELQTTI